MAEQTAEDRYIECGRPCKPGHTLQWDQCQQAPDPLGELGPAIRAARNVITEWETFTASDGNLSIRQKEDRSSDEIAREVVEVVGPLLAAIHEPAPDWADLREAARNAGWTLEGGIHWGMWTKRKADGTFDSSRGWIVMQIPQKRMEFVGPGEGPRYSRSVVELHNPTPADALTATRLVGIGGDR